MIHQTIYLSGAIEYSGDPESWRIRMLRELGSMYRVIIPDVRKCCPHKRGTAAYKHWILNTFIIPDMQSVENCDHFFAYLDESCLRGAGTGAELSLAAHKDRRITVFSELESASDDVPSWLYGCLANAHLVNSFDEAIAYYKNLYVCGRKDRE